MMKKRKIIIYLDKTDLGAVKDKINHLAPCFCPLCWLYTALKLAYDHAGKSKP